MIGKWLSRSVMAGGILATALSAPMASACIYAVEEFEFKPVFDVRAECRKVTSNRDQILDDLRSGKTPFSEVEWIAETLGEGLHGCKKREDLAFALADAALGSPVRKAAIDTGASSMFGSYAPTDLHIERHQEVNFATWALARPISVPCQIGRTDRGSRLSRDKEFVQFLSASPYWEQALGLVGQKPWRDRIVLDLLIDPQSPKFDVKLAARLAIKYVESGYDDLRRGIIIDVAETVTNPQFGEPDYEAAAKLLDWYSPYGREKLSANEAERIRTLWVRIAQTRLSSGDPELKRSAEELFRLQSVAQAGAPFSVVLPAGAELVILDEWPQEVLSSADISKAASRIAMNYPGRAFRQGDDGIVEYGAIFGPDGRFQSLHVSASAGAYLDDATLRAATRYFRPKFQDKVLRVHPDKYVFIPLPPVQYRLQNKIETTEFVNFPFKEGAILVQSLPAKRD